MKMRLSLYLAAAVLGVLIGLEACRVCERLASVTERALAGQGELVTFIKR